MVIQPVRFKQLPLVQVKHYITRATALPNSGIILKTFTHVQQNQCKTATQKIDKTKILIHVTIGSLMKVCNTFDLH